MSINKWPSIDGAETMLPAQMTHLTQTTRRLRFSWQSPRKGILQVQGFDFRTTFFAREDIAKRVLPSGRLYCVFMTARLSTIMAHSSSRIPRHVSLDGHAMLPFGWFKPSDIILQLLNSRTTTRLSQDRTIVISIRMISFGSCPKERWTLRIGRERTSLEFFTRP